MASMASGTFVVSNCCESSCEKVILRRMSAGAQSSGRVVSSSRQHSWSGKMQVAPSENLRCHKVRLHETCKRSRFSSSGSCLHIRAAQTTALPSNSSTAAVEFSDTEDFMKAGGSERPFVKAQELKQMEQARAADMLPAVGSDGSLFDVVIIGCGPAGLSLAAECGKLGLSVALLGRDLPFTNNYGVWPDEFQALGLSHCLDRVWRDTSLFLHNSQPSSQPTLVGRQYGKVDRAKLKLELLQRCAAAGVQFLATEVESIEEVNSHGSTVVGIEGERVRGRLVTVAAGAASGRFLRYETEGKGVGVQTAYGLEVEGCRHSFDPDVMLFMDYRDLPPSEEDDDFEGPFAKLPSFLYAMPSSPTSIFFEETCLAARPAMPFDILKRRLQRRLQALGISYSSVSEEEWSYIPVGGSLPDTTQQHLAFGAAACMIHPATGYSITRSLTEAPAHAAAILRSLKQSDSTKDSKTAALQVWDSLWSEERKRQRAFMIFGLELILTLDHDMTRAFFETFFKLPDRYWRKFLASDLSSTDLIFFALTTFVLAPNQLRFELVKHLIQDPSGSKLIRSYARLS